MNTAQARKVLLKALPKEDKKLVGMRNDEFNWLQQNKPDWFGSGKVHKKSGLRSFFTAQYGGATDDQGQATNPNVTQGSGTLSGGGSDAGSNNNQGSTTQPFQSSGIEVGEDRTGTDIFTIGTGPEWWQGTKQKIRDLTQVKNPETGKWEWKGGGGKSPQEMLEAGEINAEEYHNLQTNRGGEVGRGGTAGGDFGGGISTRTDTQTSTSGLDKPVEEFRDKVLGAASDVMDQEYVKYEDPRFAGPAKDTLDAQQGIRDMQGRGQGAYTSAGQTAQGVQGTNIDPITGQNFLSGQGVDQYMSPHTANVIKGMQDSAMSTMQRQRNQLGADAQMAGAGMGSRSAIEKGVMAAGVQKNLGQQVAGALEGSYAQASKMKQADMEREQQRQRYNQLARGEEGQLRLAGAETGIRATDAGRQAGYQDSTMLSRVGADIEGRDQNQKDFDYQQFLEGRDHWKNQAMFGANVMGGAPSGTHTAMNTPMYRNNALNPWGSAMSGAATGYMLGGPWGAAVGGGLGYASGGGFRNLGLG